MVRRSSSASLLIRRESSSDLASRIKLEIAKKQLQWTDDIGTRVSIIHNLNGMWDEELRQYLLGQLRLPSTPVWACTLLIFLERMNWEGFEHAEELGTLALATSQSLLTVDSTSFDDGIWAGVRMSSVLLSVLPHAQYLDLLAPTRRMTTWQVTLQAIQNMLAPRGANTPVDAVLLGRMAELAKKYLDPDLMVMAETIALAVNAYCALVLAKSENVSEFTELLIKSKKRSAILRAAAVLTEYGSERSDVSSEVKLLRQPASTMAE